MIPPLDDDGCLPPGTHSADLDEIEARFGQESDVRRVEMESIRWLVDLARRAGVQRIVLDGSFATAVLEPNDVDCALLIGPRFPQDAGAEEELIEGFTFLDIHLVRQDGWDELVGVIFATDRRRRPKGMMEVISWSPRTSASLRRPARSFVRSRSDFSRSVKIGEAMPTSRS
ncbi:MAG: DUF6932 family protein [Isosphaeraceae bacterium]